MVDEKDDATRQAAKLEQAARMVERARKAIAKVRGRSPDKLISSNPSLSDEAAKRLFDEAEKRFNEAEKQHPLVAEIAVVMEESLERDRRRDMAIETILTGEPNRSPRKRAPLQSSRILRDMPAAGATWDMKGKDIADRLRKYWSKTGHRYSGNDESLIRAIKLAKASVRDE